MSLMLHILMLASAVAIHVWLRQAEDARQRLGWKIHLSHGLLICAVLGLGANLAKADGLEVIGAFGGVMCLVFLGLCWVPEMSLGFAQLVTHLIYGDGSGGGGFRPDYGPARSALAEGELGKAVRLIRAELTKQPNSFEGLWLLTKAEEGLGHYPEAMTQLDLILANPDTTDEQAEYVRAEKAHCLSLQATAPGNTLLRHAS